MMKKLLSLLFAFIVTLGGLSFTALAQAEEPLTLVIGTTKVPEVMSIAYERDAFGRMNYTGICAAAFLDRDENSQVQPNLMTDWEISDDLTSMVATFATDRGILWHDGKPLTMDDIVFTYNYLMNVKKSSYIHMLTGVERLSDTQLRLTFDGPSAFNFLNYSAMAVYVYPKHIWENIDAPNDYRGEDAVINCGPYRLIDVDMDAQIMTYEAVENYWKGDLAVKHIVVRSYDTHDSLLMALAVGEIDAMYDYSNPVDATKLSAISGQEDIDPGMSDNPGQYQVVFGLNVAPTNDLAFRKAVSKALDYELLAISIDGTDAQVAGTGIVAPPNIGFDASLPKLAQDTEVAKTILDEAGYRDTDGDGWREFPDGTAMNLLITPNSAASSSLYPRVCEIIRSNLADIGVYATIDTEHMTNTDTLRAFIYSGEYQMFVGMTSPGVAAYESAFYYYVDKGYGNPWGTNKDPEFVQTYLDMMNAADYDQYVRCITQLQRIASEDVLGMALCWAKCYFPYRTDRFTGWVNFPGYGVINNKTWCNLRAVS